MTRAKLKPPSLPGPGRSKWQRHVLVSILVGISLSACSGPSNRADLKLGTATLNIASTALAGGNPRLALNIANAVLKTDPNNVHARLARGDAFYLLGDCNSASKDYLAMLREEPRNAGAEIGLGRCALRHNPRSASVDFEHAIHDDPNNAVAFNDLGISQAEQSQFGRASASFRKALSLDPSLHAASINLGMALALGGHPDQAELVLGPLARGAGSTAKIRADYATALALGGDIKGAENALHADMPASEARSMVTELAHLPDAAASPVTAAGL